MLLSCVYGVIHCVYCGFSQNTGGIASNLFFVLSTVFEALPNCFFPFETLFDLVFVVSNPVRPGLRGARTWFRGVRTVRTLFEPSRRCLNLVGTLFAFVFSFCVSSVFPLFFVGKGWGSQGRGEEG